ncbi:MAG: ABC transporter substrate-binding protein [Sphingomonas fennica]
MSMPPDRPWRPDRRALLLAGGAGLLLAACGRETTGAPGPAAGVLRASVTGRGANDMRLLLRASGLEPQGYRVDYSEFQSGHLVIEALNGGALDYGSMSEIPPAFAAASSRQSFRQIAVVRGDVNNQVVLLPRGSQIRDLAGLRGKRVGYVRATTTQYFLIRMLQSVGLGWGDIVPVPMTVSDGAAAFSSGALDAWAIYGFPIQRAMATEGATILRSALGFLSGNYVVSAHVDALADPERARLIGDYLTLSQRAHRWAAAHHDRLAPLVADAIGVPVAYVRDQLARQSDDYMLGPVTPAAIASQQAVADLFAEQKLIPRAVDMKPLWDDRYTRILETA